MDTALRALIVDDEPLGILRVRDLLESERDVEILGECTTGEEALEAIRRLRPNLVFLDIRMPGMDGFEVLEELSGESLPMVVFLTAYDQYALQAFDVHAVDYLLKPLREDRFRDAMIRVRQLMHHGLIEATQKVMGLLAAIEQRRPITDRFVVRDRDRYLFIKAEDVEAIEATGNYTHLHRGRETFMIREHLTTLESCLGATFARVHRSWIVQSAHIQAIRVLPTGAYVIEMQGGTKVPVGKTHRGIIEALLRKPTPGGRA